MQPRFKVGDEVVCVRTLWSPKSNMIGKAYEILWVDTYQNLDGTIEVRYTVNRSIYALFDGEIESKDVVDSPLWKALE
jgi:hypothetical protein